MKILFISIVFTAALFVTGFTTGHINQIRTSLINSAGSDSIQVTKILPLYTASDCIKNLLKAIEKSNAEKYDPKLSFYGLYLNNRNKYRYMEVYVGRWNDARDTSYFGALKIKNMTFLCRGDFKDSKLFHQTNQKITVKLRHITRDSTTGMNVSPNEPSLQGTLKICKGLPLYIEVFTINRITGYNMHIKK